jgi:hypothetical protein
VASIAAALLAPAFIAEESIGVVCIVVHPSPVAWQ